METGLFVLICHYIIRTSIVVAKTIENSFNRIKDSNVNQDLKSNLQALGEAVAKIVPQLPEGEARDASKALETVTREATSEKPDSDYFAVGARKLLSLVKTVGEGAGPIVSLVGTVAKLLGFAGVSAA